MDKKWTSRDRVLAAVNHQQPDCVPAGWAGINEGIERKLKDHFNLQSEDVDGMLEALGIDMRYIHGFYGLPYIGPQRQPVIAMSAVAARGDFWYSVYTGRLNAARFVEFLKDFMR